MTVNRIAVQPDTLLWKFGIVELRPWTIGVVVDSLAADRELTGRDLDRRRRLRQPRNRGEMTGQLRRRLVRACRLVCVNENKRQDRSSKPHENTAHQVLLGAERALLTSPISRRSISAVSSALTLKIRPPCASFSNSALTLKRVTFNGCAWTAITYWFRKPATSRETGLETLRSVTITAF